MKIDNFITEAPGDMPELSQDDKNKQRAGLQRAKSATGSKTAVSIAQKGIDTAMGGKAGTQMLKQKLYNNIWIY